MARSAESGRLTPAEDRRSRGPPPASWRMPRESYDSGCSSSSAPTGCSEYPTAVCGNTPFRCPRPPDKAGTSRAPCHVPPRVDLERIEDDEHDAPHVDGDDRQNLGGRRIEPGFGRTGIIRAGRSVRRPPGATHDADYRPHDGRHQRHGQAQQQCRGQRRGPESTDPPEPTRPRTTGATQHPDD